jgi:putative spermidine/putrescine transport system permease protein
MLIALATPGAVVLTLFFVVPVGSVLIGAFADGGSAFHRLAGDRVFWNGLRGTLVLGTVAPLFSLAVGFCVALTLARAARGVRTAALIAISLPLTFSGLIVAYGFILLLGRAGFVTLLLARLGLDPAVTGSFIYSPYGLGLAYSYYLVPRVVLIVLPAISNFDRGQLLAARSLGANAFRAVLEIMLPQLLPSLVAAFCLTSAVAVGAYGTALALVGTQVNILPLVLYSKISETGTDLPAASAASLVLIAICALIVSISEAVRPAGKRSP